MYKNEKLTAIIQVHLVKVILFVEGTEIYAMRERERERKIVRAL